MTHRDVAFKWFSPANFVESSYLSHRLGRQFSKPSCLLKYENEPIDLSEISVVYMHRPGEIEINKQIDDSTYEHWLKSENKNYIRETLETLDVNWFPGSPSHIYKLENDKLKELHIATTVGLKLPDTIVTNNPKTALEFYRQHSGRIISKRYRFSVTPYRNVEFASPTSPVSLRDIGFIREVCNTPTLFQEYIPKEKELRVTIIGEKTVTAEIDSQQTHRTRHDWRNYDNVRTSYKKHKLPDEIHKSLIALTNKLELSYGTADFVITPKGEYIFLELNPAGQYLWIENAINVNITGMICDELISHSKP